MIAPPDGTTITGKRQLAVAAILPYPRADMQPNQSLPEPVSGPRACLAEAVGTFALVFIGCGAIMVERTTGALGHAGVSACFGLVIGCMIFATGHVSGAHFNPAVTLAFVSLRRIGGKLAAGYIASQLVAATAAALLLLLILGPVADVGATVPSGSVAASFALEVVLTFFLMFVITAVATDERASQGLAAVAIGAAVAMDALMGGPISGASMNPARSFGPALASGQFAHFWLYVLAPIIGALLGAQTYRRLQ